jgi:thiamine-monophosphate kinase
MIDLSDGLGVDLPRLARVSKVGFEIDENLLPRAPRATIHQAMSDGEDYELLFAISPRDRRRLRRAWRKKFPRLSLTRIGSFSRQLTAARRGPIRNPQLPLGYVHFGQRR